MDKLKTSFQSIAYISRIKRKQWINLGLGLVIVLFASWAIFSLMSDNTSSTRSEQNQTDLVNMTNLLTHVNESSIWVERTQNALAQTQKTTASLNEQLQLLNQAKTEQEKSNQDQNQQVRDLQNEVNGLEQKMQTNTQSHHDAAFPSKDSQGEVIHQGISGVSEDVLALSPQQALSSLITSSRTPDTYVPAGTFVRAVMLGGADAAAGVTSQGNPTPMLFRLLDQGTLPNHHKSHLKDCLATAAVIGDISSERGQIRLERLSCVAPNNEIVDISVEGTVFGPEGKNGVRGIPLWREGALLQRAFIAGTLSGLSSGIAQQYTTTSVSPLGTTTSINNGDIFKYGAANGVSNAMDKLADYNINRADQYHPVVQLSAGTVIDIVFLTGFFLDGQKHNDNQKESVLPSFSMNPAAINSSPTTLPLTPQQIDALKMKTATESGL